ncbi:MAG: hypothetical protein AAGI52_14730 [Bacteroidota bacterium]
MSTRSWVAENFLDDPVLWRHVVEWALPLADTVEFNALPAENVTQQSIEAVDGAKQPLPKAQRLYTYGRRVRFALSEDLRQKLSSMEFGDWLGGPLEDPAFYSGAQPLVESITHEGYVYAHLTDTQRQALLDIGVDFANEVGAARSPAAPRRWTPAFMRWFGIGALVAFCNVMPSAIHC